MIQRYMFRGNIEDDGMLFVDVLIRKKGNYVKYKDYKKELEEIIDNIESVIDSYGNTGEDARDMKTELLNIIERLRSEVKKW